MLQVCCSHQNYNYVYIYTNTTGSQIMENIPFEWVSFIINCLLAVIIWLAKRQARAQDEKMTATVTELAAIKAKVHQMETMLPREYLTKHEFNQFRTEMNENFREVHRDLKLILRGLGVKDAA